MSIDPSAPLPAGTTLLAPNNTLGKRLRGIALAIPVITFFALVFVGVRWTIVLAVIATVVSVVVAKDAIQAAFRWRQPALQISSAPYALGSMPTVVYRRKPKRVTDIAECAVECVVVCEERVVYQQGTDTRRDSRRVYERRCDGTGEGTADGLVAELVLDITAHLGAPSLELEHNQVVWFVEVSVSGPRLPRDSHTFIIQVAPVLDPAHRVGLQDT